MGANLFPVNAVSGAPSYTGRMLRQTAVGPFVAMGSAARPLGAKSGVRPGTPSSIVAVTSTTWTVHPFAGVLDGESLAIAGAYTYSFDTDQTGTIAPAGGAARVDRLDVQVSDPAESDGSSTPAIKIIYTQGAATGGATPAAPARSHKLCLINVPTSGSPTVSWAPDWSGDPGEWQFNTLAELTAYTTAIGSANVPANQQSTIIADTAAGNNGVFLWSGTTWKQISTLGRVAFVPTFTNFTVGTSVITASYMIANGRCWVDIKILTASGWFIPGAWTIVAPVTPAVIADGLELGRADYLHTGTGYFLGGVLMDGGGNARVVYPSGSGSFWAGITMTAPAAFGNNDVFSFQYSYPI